VPDDVTVIVLAAGGGTRMKSKTMKVLYPIAGRKGELRDIRQRGVLAQPTQRNSHRAVPTSARLKRTSPSIMSRMSSTLFRNINVRSTPIPNAKPE